MNENSAPIYRRAVRALIAAAGFFFCLYCLWMAARIGYSRLLSAHAANPIRHTIPDMDQLDAVDAATALTPSDPEARLVRAALLQAYNRLDEAIKEYEQAITLRPQDHDLWLELGLTRDQAGDQEGAITALKEAVLLAPSYAEPRWQLGNLLLRVGRLDEAFAEMRLAARMNPALLSQLIDLAWAIHNGDVRAVEQAIQPQTPRTRLALARFAARHGKAGEAVAIFRTIPDLPDEDRRSLLNELLTAKQFAEAYEVWLIGAKGESAKRSGASITDPGFEEQIKLDALGFGWQIARDLQSARVTVDRSQPRQGASSLRIDWSGDSNPASPVISQIVLVQPNARYRLSFSFRTEKLVTGGLPVVAITDSSSNDSRQLAQSNLLPQGTNAWQNYSVEFTTGEQTRAVLVALRRQGCSSGPCPVFGSLWLDDFSLQKL